MKVCGGPYDCDAERVRKRGYPVGYDRSLWSDGIHRCPEGSRTPSDRFGAQRTNVLA
jgi:hypothetical protein